MVLSEHKRFIIESYLLNRVQIEREWHFNSSAILEIFQYKFANISLKSQFMNAQYIQFRLN